MKNSTARKNYINRFVVCVLFVFFFAMYHYNIVYLYPFSSAHGNLIFDADLYALEGTRTLAFYNRGMERHLLFSPIAHGVFKLVKAVYPNTLVKKLQDPFISSDNFHLSDDYTICLVMALFAITNIIIAFYILKFFLGRKNALFFTIFYGFSFSNLVFFSISETYVLSDFIILVYSFALIYLVKNKKAKLETDGRAYNYSKETIILPLINGLATLFSPPLVVLLVPTCYVSYYCLQADKFCIKKALSTILYNTAIVVIVFVALYTSVHGTRFYKIFMSNYNSYGTSLNFLIIKNFIRVFVAFIFFSIITPFNKIAGAIDFKDFWGYFSSFHRIILISFYCYYLLVVFKYIIKQRNILINAFLLFIVSIQLFYLYLSPGKLMLYSSQVVFPLMFIFAYVFETIEFKHKYSLLSSFLFILALNNASSLLIYSSAIEYINRLLAVNIF